MSRTCIKDNFIKQHAVTIAKFKLDDWHPKKWTWFDKFMHGTHHIFFSCNCVLFYVIQTENWASRWCVSFFVIGSAQHWSLYNVARFTFCGVRAIAYRILFITVQILQKCRPSGGHHPISIFLRNRLMLQPDLIDNICTGVFASTSTAKLFSADGIGHYFCNSIPLKQKEYNS